MAAVAEVPRNRYLAERLNVKARASWFRRPEPGEPELCEVLKPGDVVRTQGGVLCRVISITRHEYAGVVYYDIAARHPHQGHSTRPNKWFKEFIARKGRIVGVFRSSRERLTIIGRSEYPHQLDLPL